MAEAVFAHEVSQAGLDSAIVADSAGTGSWHIGDPPHAGTRKTLKLKGIDYSHIGRQISRDDLTVFDYIVAMDQQNMRDIKGLGNTDAKVMALLSLSKRPGPIDVPDPWYTGDFDETFQLIDDATDGLLDLIRRDYRL